MPSEYIMIPRSVVYNQLLPPQVLRTGLMLSCLLEPGDNSLEIEMRQLKAITGRSEASLYNHLALLRMMGFLNWEPDGRRGLRLEFSIFSASLDDLEAGKLDATLDVQQPGDALDAILDDQHPDGELDAAVDNEKPGHALEPMPQDESIAFGTISNDRETPGTVSPFESGLSLPGGTSNPEGQARHLQAGGDQDEERARRAAALRGAIQAKPVRGPVALRDALSRIRMGRTVQEAGAQPGTIETDPTPTRDPPLKNSKLLKSPSFNPPQLINILTIGRLKEGSLQNFGVLELETVTDPIKIYWELTRVHLNQAQRTLIAREIRDPGRWRESITHWLEHRWNPRNVRGMLALYNRGGASYCRYCGKAESAGMDAVYAEVLEELKHGRR